MEQKIKIVEKDLSGKFPNYIVTLKDENCPKCGSEDHIVNDRTTHKFMDVDEDGNFCIVTVKNIHYKCKNCNKIWQTFSEDMKNSYTKEFGDKVTSDFLYTDKSIQDIADESLFDPKLIEEIICDYKNEWDSKKNYTLPSDIGIAKIDRSSETYYALTDVVAMTVLDVLKKEEFSGLDTQGVRNIYLIDIDIPKKILKKFGKVNIIHLEKSINNSLLRALVKDLKNIKDDAVQEAVELIKNGYTYPFEFLRKHPIFAPHFFVFENAHDRIVNKERLEQLPGLENYNRFVDLLDNYELGYKDYSFDFLDNKYLDMYLEEILKYVDEAENLAEKYNSENHLLAKLLYSGDLNTGLKIKGIDEILYNFGRRI